MLLFFLLFPTKCDYDVSNNNSNTLSLLLITLLPYLVGNNRKNNNNFIINFVKINYNTINNNQI